MPDLKILNLNNKSDKYLFKKKLTLRRKSKKNLIKETFLMLIFSIFLLYLNYLIPDKKRIFVDFFNNLNKTMDIFLSLVSYLYEIFLIIFIVVSLIIVVLLIFGIFSRISKIVKRKTRKIPFK